MATYTDWMTRLYDGNPQFQKQKLGHIVIPGTHDSGSFGSMVPTAQTQDRDLGDQHEGGIRYFDIRVMWVERKIGFDNKTFYLVHSQETEARTMKFAPQLKKIAEFAEKHPKEIIILAVTHLVTPNKVMNEKKELVVEAMPAHIKGKLRDLITDTLPRRIFPYHSHHIASQSVSEIEIGSAVDAGQNIIIISSELEKEVDAIGEDASRFWFWPARDSWGSWDETQYISEGHLLADRLWNMGFRDTLTKLLLRRDEEARRHNPEEKPPYNGDTGLNPDKDGHIDLSRRLFVLEFGFSTATVLTSAPDVNKEAIKWMKEWERGVRGPGPSGRGATTRRQINVVAVDYYNRADRFTTEDEIFLGTVFEMNQGRLLVWQELGDFKFKVKGGISSELAVGRNQNGLPQAFAVGKDGKLWSNWETLDGPWTGWSILREAPKGVNLRGAKESNRIAVGSGKDELLELFACGSDGKIWHTWQNEINGVWIKDDWQTRGDGPVFASDIAVGKKQNGRLDLFVIKGEDSSIYHTVQTPDRGGVWEKTWKPLGKPPKGAERLAVNQDSVGRLEVVVLSDSQLYRIRQSEPNSDVWEKAWKELGPTEHDISSKVFNVGRNEDGRLEVFAWRGRNLWHTRQRGDNKDWDKTWESLGEPPKGLGFEQFFDEFAVGTHEDGRLVVYALNSMGSLWQVSHTSAGRWGAWEPVSAVGGPGHHLQFGRTKAGAPILFTWDDSSTLWGYEV
jgi:hypothetical protein